MQRRQLPWYGQGAIYDQDDLDAVNEILQKCVADAKGFFRLPEEKQFQEAFAANEESGFSSAVNSCGTGLDLALQVLGVGPGDEVITTPLTFVCTATCALLKGAKVVFADIDPHTYNLDPASVERRLTERTKAIIPVHFAGLPADIDGFEALKRKYGVPIVYDAAHAAGARYMGKGIGGFGDMTAYSFQSNKNMSTLGEGGAVTTNNALYHQRLERLKSFGFVYGQTDDVVEAGTNLRMTKLQAAVGLTQLRKLGAGNETRRTFAGMLNERLRDVPELRIPAEPEGSESAWHLYTLLFDDQAVGVPTSTFISLLKERHGIGATVHYRPVYEWTLFRQLGYTGTDVPVAAKVARQLFNVPLFPWMRDDDFAYIAWAVKETIASLKRSEQG